MTTGAKSTGGRPAPPRKSPSERVGENVRVWRGSESVRSLAERLAGMGGGSSLSHAGLTNIEKSRKGAVTIEEWMTLAAALNVPPIEMLLPRDNEDVVAVTSVLTMPAHQARAWLNGQTPPRSDGGFGSALGDYDEFVRKLPREEQRERVSFRHPAIRELQTLEVFIRSAVLDDLPPGATPAMWAKRLRETLERVGDVVKELAAELETEGQPTPMSMVWPYQRETTEEGAD